MTETPMDTTAQVAFPDLPEFENYWGSDETIRVPLPDGVQYFVIQPMNEGAKARFQRMTNRDVILEQKTQNARFSVDPAQERHELIKASVIDWHMFRKDKNTGQVEEVRFTKDKLASWLQSAPPHVVEHVEHKIRLANPWLQAQMTLDAMYEERKRLDQLIEAKEREERGEDDSANR